MCIQPHVLILMRFLLERYILQNRSFIRYVFIVVVDDESCSCTPKHE